MSSSRRGEDQTRHSQPVPQKGQRIPYTDPLQQLHRRGVEGTRHGLGYRHPPSVKPVGVGSSDKMDKTVVVTVRDRVQHPLYKKIVNRTVKYKAHDENNECRVGDRVLLMETRPMSKDKRWRVVEIIEKAK